MGSVGVYTGRLTGTQFSALLSDRDYRSERAPRLGQITTEGHVPEKVVVRNEDGTYSYTLDMSGVRVPAAYRNASPERQALERDKIKDAYLRTLRGRINTDNAQTTYDTQYALAKARGYSDKMATDIAQRARSKVAMEIAQKVANQERFRNSGITVTSRRNLDKYPSMTERRGRGRKKS